MISLLLILHLAFKDSRKSFHRRCLWQMHKECRRCNIPTCFLEEHHGTELDARPALHWWFFWGCFKFDWLVAVGVLFWFLFVWGFFVCLGFFFWFWGFLQWHAGLSFHSQHQLQRITFKINQIIILGRKKGPNSQYNQKYSIKKKNPDQPRKKPPPNKTMSMALIILVWRCHYISIFILLELIKLF